MIKATVSVLVALTLSLLVGCAPAKAPLPPQMQSGIAGISSAVASTEAQLNQAVVALEGLSKSNADVGVAASNYNAQLDRLNEVVASNRSKAEAASPDALFANWKAELDNMSNEQLREAGRERYEATKSQFDSVKGKIDRMRDAFRPHYKDLQDIGAYLKNDSTAAGLKQIQPTIKRVLENNKKVIERADDVQKALTEMTRQG